MFSPEQLRHMIRTAIAADTISGRYPYGFYLDEEEKLFIDPYITLEENYVSVGAINDMPIPKVSLQRFRELVLSLIEKDCFNVIDLKLLANQKLTRHERLNLEHFGMSRDEAIVVYIYLVEAINTVIFAQVISSGNPDLRGELISIIMEETRRKKEEIEAIMSIALMRSAVTSAWYS